MAHKFNKTILREYDIRGIVGNTLTAKDAFFIGKKFSTDIRKQYKNAKIAIGYDGRMSSNLLERQLTKGLLQGGAKVNNIGVCPSPMLYYACKALNCDGAIMITGSHNPPDYNGFKILSREQSYYGKKIIDLAKTEVSKHPISGGEYKYYDIAYSYILELTKNLNKINSKVKVVWDPGNGSTCEILNKLIKVIPGKHKVINANIDGTFPSHHPDPTVEENLLELKKNSFTNKIRRWYSF